MTSAGNVWDWGTEVDQVLEALYLGHMLPPLLHLSDIHCKCFPCWCCHGMQKTAINDRTMKMSVSGVERLYNSPMKGKCCKIHNVFNRILCLYFMLYFINLFCYILPGLPSWWNKRMYSLWIKFVSVIVKLTWNYVHNRICRNLCSKFVNSFARCQHLFDIAAKPADVDRIFSRILFFLFPVSSIM